MDFKTRGLFFEHRFYGKYSETKLWNSPLKSAFLKEKGAISDTIFFHTS